MHYYEQNMDKTAEYRRCRLYVEIGTFYKNVIVSQIDGTDQGMYAQYWNSLTELKALNDKEPDRDLITLRIYREIASRVVEYAKYFKEDGVPREDMDAMLAQIESDLKDMELGAVSAVKDEIEAIRWIIDGAYKMVRSTY